MQSKVVKWGEKEHRLVYTVENIKRAVSAMKGKRNPSSLY